MEDVLLENQRQSDEEAIIFDAIGAEGLGDPDKLTQRLTRLLLRQSRYSSVIKLISAEIGRGLTIRVPV